MSESRRGAEGAIEPSRRPVRGAAQSVLFAYVATTGVFALAASLIWAINTIFLLEVGGLSLFQVMVVNGSFTLAQLVLEVPTGVVADTIGRRAAILLSMATLVVSTLGYVLTPRLGWGMAGFIGASALLGLGYTLQTGAVDAWLVDALDAVGFGGPKEAVFARGQIAFGSGMLIGSLLGGLFGQFDLALPYLVRAALFGIVLAIALALVRDLGFEPRKLSAATFYAETQRIFRAGVRFGIASPVVRPLLVVSGLGGVFFMYAFYAWQPYILQLLGRDAVWLLGVAQAAFAAAQIAGNSLVGRIMGTGRERRDPARVCAVAATAEFVVALAIAGIGSAGVRPGVVPALAASALWVLWGFVFGTYGPIRAAYLNAHIPSRERATVLSLDALFADAGGVVGQPALGWLSDRSSIAVAWMSGAMLLAFSAPLYLASGRAAARSSAGE